MVGGLIRGRRKILVRLSSLSLPSILSIIRKCARNKRVRPNKPDYLSQQTSQLVLILVVLLIVE